MEEDRVDLWWGKLTYQGWRSLAGILSHEERSRAQRFVAERDTRRYIISHAIKRVLLARYVQQDPAALTFSVGTNFKPQLSAECTRPVHFSLSRSGELVLLGIAKGELGVDVEQVTSTMDTPGLPQLFLSDYELSKISKVPPGQREQILFQFWTQKEAYLKATGSGLTISPRLIELRYEADGPRGLASVGGNGDAARAWSIERLSIQEDFVGAVATAILRPRFHFSPFDTCLLLDRAGV